MSTPLISNFEFYGDPRLQALRVGLAYSVNPAHDFSGRRKGVEDKDNDWQRRPPTNKITDLS